MPVTADYLQDQLEGKEFVKETSQTYHGLLVVQSPGRLGGTPGEMLRTKGWAVDFVGADRELVHFVPIDDAVDGGDS